MALTSILRMDKINFDTLRAPLGIRLSASLLPSLLQPHLDSSDWTFRKQSLAEIAQPDEVHLAQLHGSDPKKVARLDHIFEQPFQMGLAGDAVPAATMCSVFVFTSTTAATSAHAVAAEVAGRATDAARADEWARRRSTRTSSSIVHVIHGSTSTIPGPFGRCAYPSLWCSSTALRK
ncbi:hypothetical protein EDB85DRAFT_1894731 [Lactarius pseudohatsudake]|nr:hypothetical protein EDB85DRAFT_1894731 [Lactarius pseudohatsudake]